MARNLCSDILQRSLEKCLLLILLSGTFAASAFSQGLPFEVTSELRRAKIPVDATATYIQEVGSRAAWISMNIKKPFNPASTMKLVTTNAALDLLGTSYKWKTVAYVSGNQHGDVLQGDLIIKGGGDPKFLIEDFWQFLRQIQAQGIREIRGNLILDRSAFEETIYDAAAFDGAADKAYNAGPDALLLNFKALKFQFSPDEANGKVKVIVEPPMADFTVGVPSLAHGNCNGWKEKLNAEINKGGASFPGTYDVSCGEKEWFIHPYQLSQDQYFSAVFRQVWHDIGGTFSGDVKGGKLPEGARQIAEWSSPVLPEIVKDINKFSNNVMARHLLLTLAADPMGQPSTTEQGVRVVKGWLANKGIVAPELVIENGSGLSRIERISAGTMGKILAAAWRSPLMPEFVSSLPLVGHDGTMRYRLKDADVAGKAHIKTGALREVRSIAGYVQAASGKSYVVVNFINHPNAGNGRPAQDALLQWVYENG
jgi:serine-type D-Ala-D-Ala carboxypeptidase/endopeptidase (penicillin-binding protein 4)